MTGPRQANLPWQHEFALALLGPRMRPEPEVSTLLAESWAHATNRPCRFCMSVFQGSQTLGSLHVGNSAG